MQQFSRRYQPLARLFGRIVDERHHHRSLYPAAKSARSPRARALRPRPSSSVLERTAYDKSSRCRFRERLDERAANVSELRAPSDAYLRTSELGRVDEFDQAKAGGEADD